ncbi:hypothetical protein [Streptoalloteichus hindustanus]|uniref:Uncharacterized protein n=1 Tax=Streptoalloteichus hindustanus TaxID=2017 RepID=A0A1M5NDM8_STRHI|nr:hypothetical protein [Streptoalloteichus hindustanus]SHG87299.1 hypothetical protein SAMN05444320_11592 [Streptoalloteichus hindustanus]
MSARRVLGVAGEAMAAALGAPLAARVTGTAVCGCGVASRGSVVLRRRVRGCQVSRAGSPTPDNASTIREL